MGKYEPLGQFLRSASAAEVAMTFDEIERVTGVALPRSKVYPAWWSNNPSNNVMTRVWLDAGFRTRDVDVVGGKVVFVRDVAPAAGTGVPSRPGRPKLLGALKGWMRVAPGVDLTEPADPDWGRVYDR